MVARSLADQIKVSPKPVARKSAEVHLAHFLSAKEVQEFERLAILLGHYTKLHENDEKERNGTSSYSEWIRIKSNIKIIYDIA